nr:DUF5006 domain-containing protein [uncultured Bacteroides sp.]
MKNLIYKILLPVGFLAVCLSGCKDDEVLSPLPEAVPLTMTVSSQSLVMGDHLFVDFDVDGRGVTANEDVSIFLTAKSGDTDYSNVFTEFPSKVILKKGEASLRVDLPIVETGITEDISLDLSAFVRGYRVTGATQTILISDYYRTVMSLKSNADKVVNEGETFVIIAKVATAVEHDVVVTITPKEGETDMYENLPASLTIPEGETTVESAEVTIKKDGIYTKDKTLTLYFQTLSTQYPLMAEEMAITMKDIDTPLGDKLQDERWVYADPKIPFVSTGTKDKVVAWYGEKVQLMKEEDAHPSEELAAEGWKFWRAYEFHKIEHTMYKEKKSLDGSVTTKWYPNIFANQNTAAVQTYGAVDNVKCVSITDGGYLRMIVLKEDADADNNTAATYPKGKHFLTSAFYANKFNANNAENMPMNVRIFPGMRIEFRTRLAGALNGILPGIWFQGNATDLVWPKAGEIDVLENAPWNNSKKNFAEQTFHINNINAENSNDHWNPSVGSEMTDISQWNIYWMEWPDENSVTIGINGKACNTITKAEADAKGMTWPFNKDVNPEGLHLLLTMMFQKANLPNKDNWDDISWASGFSDITYSNNEKNENTPRMEIDWIRFYKNANYSVGDKKFNKGLYY